MAVSGLRGDIRLRAISTACSAPAVAAARAVPHAAAAHEFVATVTLAEGRSVLMDGANAYVPASSVGLPHAEMALRAYDRPSAAFVDGMPAAFRDTVSPQLAKLASRMRSKAQVPAQFPEFRAALIARVQDHPEWNAVLGR
jgi:hypothetical protein